MNQFLEAIVLGIVQGLTEFLPVSSSGHLEIFKALFGDTHQGEASLLMTVALHFATALSTVIVFRKDIGLILHDTFLKRGWESKRLAFLILISMIPAALIGILLEDQIEALFTGNLIWVGVALLLTGGLLWLSDRMKESDHVVDPWRAIVIGIAQAIAIIPGISRSGATITTALFMHTQRYNATRFSFLMVIPLIFGKMAKDLLDGTLEKVASTEWLSLGIGFTAAFITGIWACTSMLRWVQNSKLKYFAWYCFVIGSLVIFYHLFIR
ncbi:MAG: undecaprenyl-diphosphate phosphatase [Saprospiraceae bacterium]|nr:undecaprenyl-diphosphate phosphatase [Saprospiraceae bacterium]